MRILVIDDDAFVARAIQRGLGDHDVDIETDPAIGIARVIDATDHDEIFDVVVCDLMMAIGGDEVIAALRSSVIRPIVILVSGDDAIIDATGLADGVLVKPFRAAELIGLIARIKDERAHRTTQRMRRADLRVFAP